MRLHASVQAGVIARLVPSISEGTRRSNLGGWEEIAKAELYLEGFCPECEQGEPDSGGPDL